MKKVHFLLIALVVVSLMVSGCLGLSRKEPPVQTGVVSGTIETESGEPIIGASVKLGDSTATSSDQGAFEFKDVPYGVYTIRVTVGGQEYTKAIDVKAPTTVVMVQVPNETKHATVHGTVVRENGTPVVGATVHLNDTSVQTDETGQFSFSGVLYGEYLLSVVANAKELHREILSVADPDVQHLVIAQAEIPLQSAVLWLRADNGVITSEGDNTVLSWTDSAGTGRAAIGDEAHSPRLTTSALNGKPAIAFDMSYFVVPHDEDLNADDAFTLFAVFRHEKGNRIAQKKSNNAGTTADAWFVAAQYGLGVAGSYISGDWLFGSAKDVIHVQTNVFSASDGTIKIYDKGVLLQTASGAKAQNPNVDDLYIGKRNNTGGSQLEWGGDLFELIIYKSALSDEQRAEVEAYLVDKYL